MLISSLDGIMYNNISSDESYDSDKIDSDLEAELYSTVHYEVVSTEPDNNLDIEQHGSINFISVEDSSSVIEKDLNSKKNRNMNFGLFPKNTNTGLKRKPNLIANVLDTIQVQNESCEKKQEMGNYKNRTKGSQSSSTNVTIETSNVIGKDLNSNNNRNMNFGLTIRQLIKNPNTGLKRKSNLIADVLDTIQVQNESCEKKQKIDNCKNRTKGSPSSSANVTIEISDSDSDSDSSVIFTEPDPSEFQTNIETLYLSSDSLSSIDGTSFDFNQGKDYNSSGTYKDVWKIDNIDLYRTKRKNIGRYHENGASQCANCNRKGHIAKYCTEPKVMKCFICGGLHMVASCKSRICVKCLRYGHDSRRCSFPFDQLFCNICNMRGHAEKCCPDLWRRYHLTTSGTYPVSGQPSYQSSPAYCFNCGLQGHFGFACSKSRMGNSYPTWLSVVSYDHPNPVNNEFIIDRDFCKTIPQLLHPCLPSYKQEQKKLSRKKRQQERRLRKMKGEVKGKRKKFAQNKQSAVNSTHLASSNSQQGNVCIRQEINFPRTPKATVSQPQCVDELPKIKRKAKKTKARLRRNAMKALKKCT